MMPLVLELSDAVAHLHDRDLKSARPDRVFDRAPRVGGRRGATGHHATGGEREFDSLTIVAGQPFRGIFLAAPK